MFVSDYIGFVVGLLVYRIVSVLVVISDYIGFKRVLSVLYRYYIGFISGLVGFGRWLLASFMPCSSCTSHHMSHACHALAVGLAEADREGIEHGGAHLGARLPPEHCVLRIARPREQHALAAE